MVNSEFDLVYFYQLFVVNFSLELEAFMETQIKFEEPLQFI